MTESLSRAEQWSQRFREVKQQQKQHEQEIARIVKLRPEFRSHRRLIATVSYAGNCDLVGGRINREQAIELANWLLEIYTRAETMSSQGRRIHIPGETRDDALPQAVNVVELVDDEQQEENEESEDEVSVPDDEDDDDEDDEDDDEDDEDDDEDSDEQTERR